MTAAACAKLGLRCVLFHNAEPQTEFQGNPLLNHLMGTEIVYCGKISEPERLERMKEYAGELSAQGRKAYIVGDPVVGALGYVNSALELVHQAERKNIDLRHIFLCASAGPTEAGLLYGLMLFGKSFHVHFVSVEYDRDTFFGLLEEMVEGVAQKLGVRPAGTIQQCCTFYDDYMGEGYAVPTAGCIDAAKWMAQQEAIFLETTYNAKTYEGLFDLVRKGVIPSDEAVCIYHTGGTPVLFSQHRQFY